MEKETVETSPPSEGGLTSEGGPGTKEVPPFGGRDKLGYMFGDFGNDFTFLLSSGFMLKFYTDVMGIPGGVVGILMMAARFVDAVTDVTMGQIVDRAKPTKEGKFIIVFQKQLTHFI